MEEIFSFIIDFVGDFGYFGIFFMMLLESSFVPFPSEVVMIPAGYLAYLHRLSLPLALICGVAGSIAGALVNYYIALFLGRAFLIKYGKYFLFTPSMLEKTTQFFTTHGAISTFIGRLLPAIRQYISFPAGLARLRLSKFIFFTFLGALIWNIILVFIGYYLASVVAFSDISALFDALLQHSDGLLSEILTYAVVLVLVFCALVVIIYFYKSKNKDN